MEFRFDLTLQQRTHGIRGWLYKILDVAGVKIVDIEEQGPSVAVVHTKIRLFYPPAHDQ